MRRYETVIIIDPDVSEEKHTSILDKMNQLVNEYGGLLIRVEKWGIKKTAYEIKRKSRGYYIKFDFCSKVTMIREMEYFFGITDSIIKYMTILLEKKVNIDAIKSALAEAEQSETKDYNTEKKDKENNTEASVNILENETTIVDEEE